jgi:hypothetical protein
MLIGTRPLETLVAPHAEIPAEALVLADANISLISFESRGIDPVSVVPPALHPTSPSIVSLLVIVSDAVRVALVRVSCRHGARARALLVGSIGEAGPLHGLGIDPLPGNVVLEADRVTLGEYVSIGLFADRQLGSDDVQFVTGLHPLQLPGVGLRLAQVEIDVQPLSAPQRCRPELVSWTAPISALQPGHPVAAVTMQATVTIPPVRFVARADVLAHLGSETLQR